MDLTSDDVQDILDLLDGLPFGEMHVRTARFSLWLRRGADGEWTQEMQVLSEPAMTPAAPGEPGAGGDGASGTAGVDTGVSTDRTGGAGGADSEVRASGAEEGAARGTPAAGAPEPDGLLRAVRAPLPGTFYRAPMPGAPPFVDVGGRVEPDTVVGIIETMKLMNSVSAGARGTVEQIPLANAQFAERDAVLMWVREDP